MVDGAKSTAWKVCTPEYLGAVSTTRVIILPLCLVIAAVISLILVFQAAGVNPLTIAIPAICLVLCSIFLFFSLFWPVGIVITLAALFAMGAAQKGGSAFLWALFVELFALAVVTGGLGLGSFFFSQATTPQLFFDLGGPTGAHSTSWSALQRCSTYYDYFFVDPTNVPFDADPAFRYRNYCSEGWYTYIGLVADFVVTLQIIMLAATGVAYLRGSSGAKSV
jgi:hypothetical protein